jgi:hypothetical protein
MLVRSVVLALRTMGRGEEDAAQFFPRQRNVLGEVDLGTGLGGGGGEKHPADSRRFPSGELTRGAVSRSVYLGLGPLMGWKELEEAQLFHDYL